MKPAIHSCFELFFEYKRHDYATDMTHIYTAESPAAAVRDALAFWQGRHAALPEFFAVLYCVKISAYRVGPIVRGQIHNGRGMPFFEYKFDTAGMTLEAYVEMRAKALEPST